MRRANRFVDCGRDHVLQHLDVLGIDGGGVDRDRDDLQRMLMESLGAKIVSEHPATDGAVSAADDDEAAAELAMSESADFDVTPGLFDENDGEGEAT